MILLIIILLTFLAVVLVKMITKIHKDFKRDMYIAKIDRKYRNLR